jgi:ferredoxin
MAYVVTEACVLCKYTDCVAVCPVACFHEGPNFLVIAPDECIDCGACVPACPAEAIYPEADLPAHWAHFTKINADLAPGLPVIEDQKDPLPDADDFKKVGQGRWAKLGDKEKQMG